MTSDQTADDSAGQQDTARRGFVQRGRGLAVLALLAAGLVVAIAGSQTWVTATLLDDTHVPISGTDLAPIALTAGLAMLATAFAVAFARVKLGVALAIVALGLGAAVVWNTFQLDGAAAAAADNAAAEHTGLQTGPGEQVAAVERSVWPTLAAVGGGLAIAAGAWMLATARNWQVRAPATRKYERSGTGLDWDALDDGVDPTLR